MNKFLKYLFVILGIGILSIILIIFLLVHNFRKDTPDCFVADRIVHLDTIKIDNIKRIAVFRQTGFTEKVEFLELYADSAEFDICGTSKHKPIWGGMIEYPVCKNMLCVKGIQIHQDSLIMICEDKDDRCVEQIESIKFIE